MQGGGVDGGGGEEQPPHQVLGNQPRQVSRRAERAAFDLRQAEAGVVGGHDDVGVAHQADAAADAESVHGRDHRHGAFVYRAEGGEAAAVGVDEGGESLRSLHLLDVNTRVEAPAFGSQDHRVGIGIGAGGGDRVGQLEPPARRDGVDGRVVDGDRDDVRFDGGGCDGQCALPREKCGWLPKQALAWYASTVVSAEAADGINLGLAGRVVLVTGGVRGVGVGISSVFAGQGATVITCARRPVEGLPYEFHSCDVRDEEAVKSLVDSIVDEHGRIDVVVNNAGGSPYVLTAESSPKFNRKIIEHTLIGGLMVSQYSNDRMQDQADGGSIVNICSLSGRRPSPGTGAYGAAKAGLESLTQTLAVEWGPKVRVNACVVGMVETEKSELFYGDAEPIAAISKNVPLGRLATPADVGWAAAFLASDAAAYISGASLEVHGGGEPPHYLATTNAGAIK